MMATTRAAPQVPLTRCDALIDAMLRQLLTRWRVAPSVVSRSAPAPPCASHAIVAPIWANLVDADSISIDSWRTGLQVATQAIRPSAEEVATGSIRQSAEEVATGSDAWPR